jgi:hypothetical protein
MEASVHIQASELESTCRAIREMRERIEEDAYSLREMPNDIFILTKIMASMAGTLDLPCLSEDLKNLAERFKFELACMVEGCND